MPLYAQEAEALKKSSWPKCDAMAETLASHGPPAADALESAATSRTHHVRSAALRNLARVDQARGVQLAKKMLQDRAYEVRETAAKILGVPVPDKPNLT